MLGASKQRARRGLYSQQRIAVEASTYTCELDRAALLICQAVQIAKSSFSWSAAQGGDATSETIKML